MMLNTFSYTYLPSVYLLWWGVYTDLLSILNWLICFSLLSFKNSLYILDTSQFSVTYLFWYYDLSVICPLILITVFFTDPKDLILINWLIRFFFHAFSVESKNISPNQRSSKLSHMLFSNLAKIIQLCKF